MLKNKLKAIFRADVVGGSGEKVKRAAIEVGQENIMKRDKKYLIKYLQRNVKSKDDVIIWLARRREEGNGRGRRAS